MNNKTLLGALAGGVAFFFLGWLMYGMLLSSYMETHMNQCAVLKMEEMRWWALISSNLLWAYFLAQVFAWTGTATPMGGVQKGALLGLLTSLSFDLSMYSMSTMFSDVSAMGVDVAVSTLMSAIVGGIIGFVMGMGKPSA